MIAIAISCLVYNGIEVGIQVFNASIRFSLDALVFTFTFTQPLSQHKYNEC